MKPCDCQTVPEVRSLQEQGIKINDEDILILDSAQVQLTIGNCKLTINRRRFKQFAEWYLTEQEIRSCGNCKYDCENPSTRRMQCRAENYKDWLPNGDL